MEKLGLINYEGDCLRAYRDDELILIQDQYLKTVGSLSIEEFYEFIDGSLEIVDSQGKSWNFANEHPEARPKPSKIYEFIKDFRYSAREINDAFVKGWELRHMGMSEELIIHEFVIFLDRIESQRKRRKNQGQ